MFSCTDLTSLRAQMDRFQVPLFAAERSDGSTPFRILCINAAHERMSGLRCEDARGRTPHELLPVDQADKTAIRYAACADTGRPLSYSESIQLAGETQDWETALAPIPVEGEAQRIVGIAQPLTSRDSLASRSTNAHELAEAREAAALAGFHVSRLDAWLAALEAGQITGATARSSAAGLRGICRAVDSLLAEIEYGGGQAQIGVEGGARAERDPPGTSKAGPMLSALHAVALSASS